MKIYCVVLKDHLKTIEKRLAKNIGSFYRAKSFLVKNHIFLIYSFILNYANMAWGSTRITKLKRLICKKKQVVCIVFNEYRLSYSNLLLKILNALNCLQD